MILIEEKLSKESVKMVKSRRDVVTPRKRNSLSKSSKIIKNTIRPISAASSVSAVPAAKIRVVVRVRPPNSREQDDNSRIVVKVVGDQMLIFDPKEDNQGFFFHGVQQKSRDLLKKANKDLKFVFDKVFANHSTTAEVFKETTYSLITSLMDGCNCSVFAYGATGAGKTFTMTGNTEHPGITFLTMNELFSKKEELSIERDFELGITYLEVYNELVKDLLNPGPPLNLREDSTYGVTVAGIKIYKIKSPDELFYLLEQGNKNRTQHPTDANAESSRSHAVFQVYIQMTIKTTQEVRRAKLSMIDLAGSERGSATGYLGDRFKEGANINKSLLALGNCINSLADGHRHVPYRDSKLTRLLKDSLGGNCQTVMIANVSPSSLSYEDTYNTLKYATRAKKIKTNVKRNVVNVEMHVEQYVQMTEQLKRENSMLKRQLEEEKNKKLERNDDYDELKTECERLKKQLEDVSKRNSNYNSHNNELDREIIERVQELIKEMGEYWHRGFQMEHNRTITNQRRVIKEQYNDIIDSICRSTPERNEVHKKLGNTVTRFKNQELALNEELNANNVAVTEINNQLLKLMEDHPEFQYYIDACRARAGLEHKNKWIELHKKEMSLIQEDNQEKMELLERMATILKSCYMQIKGHGHVTDAFTKDYTKIIQDFQGKKSVKFHEIPDSGISSTTSITEDENKMNSNNNNKRKIEEPAVELDGTFTMSNNPTTPSKPRSRGTATDQIISKVTIKQPPAKRLANGRISPRNKENKPFRKPFDTARTLATARAIISTKATGINGKSKTPTKTKTLDRPRFRS